MDRVSISGSCDAKSLEISFIRNFLSTAFFSFSSSRERGRSVFARRANRAPDPSGVCGPKETHDEARWTLMGSKLGAWVGGCNGGPSASLRLRGRRRYLAPRIARNQPSR